METPVLIAIVVLILQIILTAIAIIYFAWKIPTKEDIRQLKADLKDNSNQLQGEIYRLESKIDIANQNFIDHLSDHSKS